jgi:hypothetical protein
VALQDLATVADLTNRGIDTSNTDRAEAFLAAAQDAVRDAAGVPITRETFTVTIPGVCEQWLRLPGQPVVSVADVLLDDDPVSDWRLVGGDLWRCDGWQAHVGRPSTVTVTVTGGLGTVPADIVDLVCAMTGMALDKAAGGEYASRGDLVQSQIRIDDYSEGESYEASSQGRLAGPMELPNATRQRLRTRFGGGIDSLRSR